MKKIYFNGLLFLFSLLLSSFILRSTTKSIKTGYDPSLVKIISNDYNGIDYCCVRMNRKDDRIKAKYFAHELNGQDIVQRYNQWKNTRKVVVACAGTYFLENTYIPDGLCVDGGTVINRAFSSKMDGLVIVYATGGVVAVNAKLSKVNVIENGVSVSFDVKNEYQKNLFLNWAKSVSATIFQTHLLAKDDVCLVAPNSSAQERERRFLVVSKGFNNNIYHSIVYTKTYITLRNFTLGILQYMKNAQQMKEVSFILNLDTGNQDWIQTFNSDGSLKPIESGSCLRSDKFVRNILAYSYE
jgi:hypothetical protein